MDSIRPARLTDIGQIVMWSVALAEEIGSGIEPCPASIGEKAASLLNRPDGFLYVSKGGFLAGEVVPCFFDGHRHAQELGWYAKDRSGVRLLRAFEAWAKARGCVKVRFSTGSDSGPAGRILERLGYKSREQAWVK